ncbi:MAG TPA: polyhydroxyalkanoate synthesis regulator DNA-binding domain-containing protein [Terriglobales bacterium]|nr:polyhydroxyalkanoate synthesis regulator DNA-binding domain-containing protein [Terriglobales bacterium]
MKSDTVIIKKYGNRRLYDTSASRYVNLEEIATLVRHGKEVRVVDAKTGEDLTRVTLTQIIVEDARVGPTGLPLDLLRQLIVASDRVGREFVMWYLNSAFNAYQKVQESLESGLSEVRSAALSPLQLMKGSLQGDSAESQALRKRIAELQARLKKPVRRRKRRKASR